MSTRGVVVLSASAVLVGLLTGVPAQAADATPSAQWQCASTATITDRSGDGQVEWYGQEAPTGATWHGDTVRRKHFYELHHLAITIDFGHVTYTISRNAIFRIGCSGVSAGSPLEVPDVSLMRGKAVVHTTRRVPGSVSTEEGLFGPVPGGGAMAYLVSRALTQSAPPSMNDKIYWYADYSNQPVGTTDTQAKSADKVNVTPYVGPDPGTCRHVDSAELTTKSSFGHGTATYG